MREGEPNALNVLIAEDDALIGMLLGETLEGMGYEVCAIETTEGGTVAAAFRHRPDLIIVDARLGDGSGIEAVETILLTGFMPHIIMSGNIAEVRALRPESVMLEKPFHEAALQRAIQTALAAKAP